MSLTRHSPYLCGTNLLVTVAVLLTFGGCFSTSQPVSVPLPAPELVADCEQESPVSPPEILPPLATLTDVTSQTGIDFTFRNGREAKHGSLLEALGGGVGLFDFDGDRVPDVFLAGGGGFDEGPTIHGWPVALYRNLGDWRFVSVSDSAGIDGSRYYNHASCCADYDNDGFIDVVLTGYGGVQLFHNLGDGTFQEIAVASGLEDSLWSSSAAWGDIDGDGNLDLYLVHYADWSFEEGHHPLCMAWNSDERDSCPPTRFESLPDTLFRSTGDGSFENVSQSSGLRIDGRGMGAIAADLDHDGDIDFYVVNDMMDNFLYINDGSGLFVEEGLQRGAAVDDKADVNASMGAELLDFDLDGWADLWITNYVGEQYAMYRNLGAAEFNHVSARIGLGVLAGQFVGWGTAAYDLDRDGDQDLLVTNGHAVYAAEGIPHRQFPVLLMNQRESNRLQPALFAEDTYLGSPHAGRGLALADLDGDGDLDPFFSNLNEPAAVLRNDTSVAGRGLRVRLVGRGSNRDAIGARLVLRTSAGDQLRHIKGGGSYASHSDQTVDWGVADGVDVLGLNIWWPTGTYQEIPAADIATTQPIIEPDP